MLHLVTTPVLMPPHVPNVYGEISVDWGPKSKWHITFPKAQIDLTKVAIL